MSTTTWSNFVQSVVDRLTVDGDRLGTVTARNKKIRDGIRDLQSFVPQLREGHSGFWYAEDLEADGCVSRGILPEGAMVRDGYYLLIGTRCAQRPLEWYDWQNRYDLICGRAGITNGFYITIAPNNREFMIYPKLDDESMALIFWDGIKADFEDNDPVLFTEEVAEAVASYVKAFIAREVDKDLQLYRSYWADYAGGEGRMGQRTKLYIDWKRQSEIETPKDSPQQRSGCEGCDEAAEEVEPVTVGNDAQTATCADLYEQNPAGTATYTVPANTITLTVPTGGDADAYKIGANAIALDQAIAALQAMITEGAATCDPPPPEPVEDDSSLWFMADDLLATYPSIQDGDSVGTAGVDWVNRGPFFGENASTFDMYNEAGSPPAYKINIIGSAPAVQFPLGGSGRLDCDAQWTVPTGESFTFIAVYKMNPSSARANQIITAGGGTAPQVLASLNIYSNGKMVAFSQRSQNFGNPSWLYLVESDVCPTDVHALKCAIWRWDGVAERFYFRENKIAVSDHAWAPINVIGDISGLSRWNFEKLGYYSTSSNANAFEGWLAEVKSWNRFLPNEELDELYDSYFKPRWIDLP